MPEQGRLPVREYGLRERYRGAMLAHPSGQPREDSWAAGFQAGVAVALACAAEASTHSGTPPEPGSWTYERARKCALDPNRMPDLHPEEQDAPVESPDGTVNVRELRS